MLMVGQMAMGDGFSDRFDRLDRSDWYVADYIFGHPHFDTDWAADQVVVDGGLHLQLSPQKGRKNGFQGASVRRHRETQYGRYTVVMKPARGAGLVTGFFTYTGPHYGARHDEIDIEFLGKNTSQIHIATFVDGKLWNKFIDLGFDAADRPRRYTFEWAPDAIRWYVEDDLIYTFRAADGPLPKMPGRLFANIWAADPSIKAWSGVADRGITAKAEVLEMSFEPAPSAPAS